MGGLAEEAALEGPVSRVMWMWCQGLRALAASPCPQPGAQLGAMWLHACWLLGRGVPTWSLERRESAIFWGRRSESGVE